MEKIILKAAVRSEKPKKIRKEGFVPGVLNEEDTKSVSVMFNAVELDKIIARHGLNAKLWIDMAGKKHFGYIMEVQKDPVEQKVIHVSVKLLKKDQEVRIHLPIHFHGRDELAHRFQELHIYKTDIEVMAKAALIPDTVTVDVTKKALGEHVTAADFGLPKEVKVMDPADEIYAAVKAGRIKVELPEPEAAAPEAESPAQETAAAKAEEG